MTAPQSNDLVFITYTDATNAGIKHDEQTQKKIRKRAWNAWWNEELEDRLKARSQRPLKQSQSRFRLQEDPVLQMTKSMKRQLHFVPSAFQNVLESSEQTWTLLDYYFHRFQQNSAAINVEGDWIAFTFSDDASRHAQLALIALNSELEAGLQVVVQTTALTSTAIKLIQDKLREMKELPDDQLVAAVALLVIIESMQDDQRSSSVHFDGLNQMIAVRGGLSSFTTVPSLRRIIIWARRVYWLRWRNCSSLPWIMGPSANNSEIERPVPVRIADNNLDRFSGLISQSLIDILTDFRYIDTFPLQAKRSSNDRKLISQAIYDVEQKVIEFHRVGMWEDPHQKRSVYTRLTRLVKNAAQIYTFVALRQMLGRSRLVQSYVQVLDLQIEEFLFVEQNIDNKSADERDLLVWVLSILLLTTYDDTRPLRLARHLAGLLNSDGIFDVQQLILTVRSVAWTDDLMDEQQMSRLTKLGLGQNGTLITTT